MLAVSKYPSLSRLAVVTFLSQATFSPRTLIYYGIDIASSKSQWPIPRILRRVLTSRDCSVRQLTPGCVSRAGIGS